MFIVVIVKIKKSEEKKNFIIRYVPKKNQYNFFSATVFDEQNHIVCSLYKEDLSKLDEDLISTLESIGSIEVSKDIIPDEETKNFIEKIKNLKN